MIASSPHHIATATAHPSWCTDHTGFSDGSEDWHKSQDVSAAGFTFHASTGNFTGSTEVYFLGVADDGVPLDQAEQLGQALLDLVKAVRA